MVLGSWYWPSTHISCLRALANVMNFTGLILVRSDVMQAHHLGSTAARSVPLPEVGFLLLSVLSFRHDLSDLEKIRSRLVSSLPPPSLHVPSRRRV